MTERSEQLISMFLQNPFAMTELQTHELSLWISQDTGNTREFINASLFHRCIHDTLLESDMGRKRIIQGDTNIPGMSLEPFDKQLWEMLLKEEETAPEIEIEHPAAKNELIQEVKPEKITHRYSKTVFMTAVASVAALILLIIYVNLVPNTVKSEVATLTGSINAQWAESDVPTGPNARLMTNHAPLMLRKGYAELVFDNNAKVVLEAPVEFQVLSYDQIKLTYGRLYATVPTEALGFIVSTPTSKIIDLGTEFGVQTDFNGTTELHVVKGKTSLVSGLNGNKINILLNAGSARKLSLNASSPIDIPCDKQIFVRQIDSQRQFVWRGQNVNLADVVGGGNGFGTGQLDRGIDPTTGNVIGTLPRKEVYTGPQGYIPVPSNPCIDGVFVPGNNPGSVQIACGGLQTSEFTKTSGEIWGYIFDGAWHDGPDTPRHCLQLNGAPLDGKENPAITMHSNLGITFNLSAMRKQLPGVRIKSFSSTFGVSETVNNLIKSHDFSSVAHVPGVEKLIAKRYSTVEFWVLLDGKKVLQQKLSSASKAGSVNIPIYEGARYLTLAVTEADDTFMFDWAVFAQPELILESADK